MENNIKSFALTAFLIAIFFSNIIAQPAQTIVEVNVAPENSNWVYNINEKVKFNISVTRSSVPLQDITISYEVGPDMMTPTKTGKLVLKNGTGTIDGGTMKEAGFLRCSVKAVYEGKSYSALATAAFSPEKIKPTTVEPADFIEFWENAKAEAAKVPIDATLRLLPERCTSKVNVYEVNMQNYRPGTRLYGILCVPKEEGKYPAILRVPGAGVRPYNGDMKYAEEGIITLEIGIHGFPVTMDPIVYDNISRGALSGYQEFNLDNKDKFYYKRVYLGCVRSVDFIFSLPEFDGENIMVIGGSQGGALSIVTAALDNRIKGLVAFYPALSDLTGYLHGRAGGWPHYFNKNNVENNNTPQKIETTRYYDVVNFARHIKVPGYYTWGYNDVVCPPTSMFSTYNVIKAPKILYLAEETGHWRYPEQWNIATDFILKQLGK